MRRLNRLPQMATVIAGDFNEWGSMAALDATAKGVHFAYTPPSYPAPRPVARLDRIAHCDRLDVVKSGHYTANPAHIASDHLPVWADLAVRGR